ncbi:medium-chain fatty acid-CoA ligase faa2 [Blastocladiella emersonii ATCC 22665]|nr:medium-chain fatty acid-CoA ligase faa2 [Blastocladiella emersonii ATCC 22665]
MEYLFGAPAVKPEVFSIETPGAPDVPGEGKPRRAAYLGDKELTSTPRRTPTIWATFARSAKLYGSRPYLGHRPIVNGTALPYVWQTYAEVANRVNHLGSALVAKKLKAGANVGIYSINCPEWMISALALFRQSMVSVPLYDTLGDEAIVHIISQTEIELAFVSVAKLNNLFKVRAQIPTLRTIVTFGEVGEEVVNKATSLGIELISLYEMEHLGAKAPAPENPPEPSTISTICYTSGTTGPHPKGAVLTHHMSVSTNNAVTTAMNAGKFPTFANGGVHFSYLPLAHVFENTVQVFAIQHGGCVGFYQGDTLKILEDIQELKPTCFISVPRLLNRIYDKVWAGVRAKGGIGETLFNMAYNAKLESLKNGYNTSLLWDTLVFSKIRALLGGRVSFVLTGSAPLSPEVMQFLRVALGVEVIEGYGQTEVHAAACITWSGDYEAGHVGVPLPCNEVKLIDVPSMNYTSKDKPFPRGEICIRGHNSFKGYYKEPEKSAEAVDKDGWVHTGDVGMWDARGRLVIIDRVKNIFKLSQGEYVAPERVEGVYQQHPIVAQAFLYGHSLESYTVTVVVPDEPEFIKWAVANQFAPSVEAADYKALAANPEVVKKALATLQEHGRALGLKGFENPRALHLETVPFSVENNLLTPTFKLRRHDARAYYQEILDGLYRSINE